MNIKKINQYDVAGSVQGAKAPATKTGADDKAAASTSADRVNLSNHYQVITQAKKEIASGDEVRMEKVMHVRTQLENRTYTVNTEAIADKMLGEIM